MISNNDNRRGRRTPLEDWRGPQSKTRRFLESSGSNWTTSSIASTCLWSRSTASNVIGAHRKLPGSLQLSYEKATKNLYKSDLPLGSPGTRREDSYEWGLNGRRISVVSGDQQDLPSVAPLSGPTSVPKPREVVAVGVHRFVNRAPRSNTYDVTERRADKPRTIVQRPSPYIANAFRDRLRGSSGRSSDKASKRHNPSKSAQRTIISYDMEVSRTHFSRKRKPSLEPRETKHPTVHKENTDTQRDVGEQDKPKECPDLVSKIIKKFRYDDKMKKDKEEESLIHPFSDKPMRPRSPRIRSRSPLRSLLFTPSDDLPWNKRRVTGRGEAPLPPLKFTYEPSILATEHLVHKFYPSKSVAPTGLPPMDMHLDFDTPPRKTPMRMGEIIKSVYKNERKLRAVQKIGPLLRNEGSAKKGFTLDKYCGWRDPILTPNEEVRGIYKKIIFK